MIKQGEVYFHGTNGWFDTDMGCTSCLSIHQNDRVFIFDAGTGIRRIPPESLLDKDVIIFLSHLHLDHSVGLHFLQSFRLRSVCIIIPSDLARYLKLLLGPPFTGGFEKSQYSVVIQDISQGEYKYCGFRFSAHKLLHNTTVFGYRLYVNDKIFTYCVDTKMCSELNTAAFKANILVCDCGLKYDHSSNFHFHMTPVDAIELAKIAEVDRLVLTHFGCTRYTCDEDRLALLKYNDGFSGELVIARDGMRLKL